MNSDSVLKVTSNPLSLILSELYSVRLEDKLKNLDTNEIDKSEVDDKKYVSSIFGLHMKVLSTFETLLTIPIYLSNLPPKKLLEKYDIPKSQYYQYHIESYIIRITTILDQLVLFVNGLYELGIDPKKCSADLVFNNLHTKDSKEVELLKGFQKGINNIKGARNKIVHRGEFADSELSDIATRELFKKTKDIHSETDKDLLMYIYLEAYVSKRYKKNKRKEISKNNDFIEKFLVNFFTNAAKTFSEKYPGSLK